MTSITKFIFEAFTKFNTSPIYALLNCVCTDGVVIGGSCIEHMVENLDHCEEGPLDNRESKYIIIIMFDSLDLALCIIHVYVHESCMPVYIIHTYICI